MYFSSKAKALAGLPKLKLWTMIIQLIDFIDI